MVGHTLRRWADRRLIAENTRLAEHVARLESTIRIQQAEIDQLAAVIARDRKRIEAETAIAAHNIATHGAAR